MSRGEFDTSDALIEGCDSMLCVCGLRCCNSASCSSFGGVLLNLRAALALDEHLQALDRIEAGATRDALTEGSGWSGQGHWHSYFKHIER